MWTSRMIVGLRFVSTKKDRQKLKFKPIERFDLCCRVLFTNAPDKTRQCFNGARDLWSDEILKPRVNICLLGPYQTLVGPNESQPSLSSSLGVPTPTTPDDTQTHFPLISRCAAFMAAFDDETTKKILTQVEFYFSDSNLPRDAFLHKTVTQSKDGLVSLALVCSFSRMRNLLGLGKIKREDIPERILEGVAEVLKKSDILKVSNNGRRVGRRTELSKTEEVLEQVDKRTIAASPFEYNIKMEDVGSFFSQYSKVNSVRLPHHIGDKRYFCGTALVEFSTDQDAEKVLKQNLVYAGANLMLTPKKGFDARREKMIKELVKSSSSTGSSHNNTSHFNFRRGLLVGFTLKRIDIRGKVTMRENPKKWGDRNKGREDKADSTGTSREKNGKKGNEDSLGKPIKESRAGVCGENEQKVNGDQDVVPLEEKSDSICSEDLKDVFQRFGAIKHVDYSPGSDSGYICFEDPETAIKARAAGELVGALLVKKSFLAALEAINGEVERECWKKFPTDLQGDTEARKEQHNNGRREGSESKRCPGKGKTFGTEPLYKAQG